MALQPAEKMTPERWQQVDTLFHSALDCAPHQRAAFLDEACARDAELRKQVEELLAAHEEAGTFIENPAFQLEAEALVQAEPQATSLIGQAIGHYRIVQSLGLGGMGDVYLAQDTILGRQVALKLLPAHFIEDDERLRRFEQEARAASALNHPNILTIYEIGQSDSSRYIVAEYIQGATLREHLAEKPMNVIAALDIAIQICRALAAAHAKGIVHRDIKPENIMISEDRLVEKENFVKVLDFGIAKLTQPDDHEGELPARALMSTSEGVTIGTAPYMSPEQTQGQKVDARSDIWSLGVVLYEMLTGRLPFKGPTRNHLMVAILESEVTPLGAQSGEVPEMLQWIVTKALRKKKEERYQTAKELLTDLGDLKHSLEHDANLKHSSYPNLTERRADTSTESLATESSRYPATQPTLSVGNLLREARRHKFAVGLISLVLLGVCALIVLGLKHIGQNLSANKSAAPFSEFKVTPVTTTGKAVEAAVSPDGKYVAYAVIESDRRSLWMRHISTSSDVQINPTANVIYFGLNFLPGGDYLAYSSSSADTTTPAELYQMPVLGGPPRKLTTDIDSVATFSPDGKQFAFLRGNPAKNEASLVVANTDGTGERKLATHHIADVFLAGPNYLGPAWSPDGEMIAFGFRDARAGTAVTNVMSIQVKDGVEKPIATQLWSFVGSICWLRDGSGLVFIAAEQEAVANRQIWYVSYPAGKVQRITNDLNDYQSVSLSADSTTLVTVQIERLSNIWIALNGDADRASQISSNKYDGLEGIAWTPNDQIVFVSRASGSPEIWIMNSNGTNQKQLTFDARLNSAPSVSADGRYVVFSSSRTDISQVWRIDIDGGNETKLSKGRDNRGPQCTFDNQSVIYTSFDSGAATLWRVPIAGGNAKQITDYPAALLAISPKDGQIAYRFTDVDEQAKPRRRIGIVPLEGGPPTRTFAFPAAGLRTVKWAPEGGALTYVDNRSVPSNIWSQSIDGGKPRQLTNFKSARIFSFAWSPDGKKLAFARGTLNRDVVLFRDITNPQ
ncbi:MAG TPA: protein kinase [Pyrinomonadaceae bacterium]|nr:protein kinase [Pyrinomonadaceae bacterium]